MKILIAAICAALFAILPLAALAATPTPTARITCDKTSEVDGNTITWTLECVNTGNASQTVEVTDTLFSGPDWLIVPGSDDFGCALTGSNTAGANKLECAGDVPRRIRDEFDDQVDGRLIVSVQGDVSTCGKFSNTAHFFYDDADHKSNASAIVACPETPTPVPTSTPAPTATPTTIATTPAATPTPTSAAAATATNTPARIAPGPPNTGNTSSVAEGEGLALWVAWTLVGMIGVGGLAWSAWRGIR